jgi:hypothetical protein
VSTLLGAALGWLPILIHGPIPEKFDLLHIRGAIAVWGFYLAPLLDRLLDRPHHAPRAGGCADPWSASW